MKLGKLAIFAATISLSALPLASQAQESDNAASGRLIAQGEGHAKSGRWLKAQDCFREACSKEPANVVALHDLATTYAHTSRLNDAAECEKKALAIDEKYVPSHVELAYVLRRLNDREGAREHLVRALELEPDNQLVRKNLEALSLPHVHKQKEESSAESPQQIAVVEPTKIAEAGDSNVSKALISRGSNMYRQGKYDVAKRFFQQALETCPESVSARSCLGVVLGSNGDIDGQIKEERAALASEPKNSAVMCNLGWALAQKGELNEALSTYQKALEVSPGTVEAQVGQGVVLFRMGKTEASLAVLKEAVHSKPENANLHLALGGVLQAAERYEEALSELQEAMKLAPNNFEVKTRLAAAYLDCEKSTKSAELYRQLIERSPSNAELRIGLGLALIKSNDINGAYIQFKKASELDKNSASAHAGLSMVEEMRGRISQAESEARIAQEKDPESQFFKESAERLAKSKVDSEM